MSLLNNLLNFNLGGGLDTSTGDRNVNLNQEYINNPAYDRLKGGIQYEDAPEGLVWDAKRGQYVKQGAPTGLLGAIAGAADWLIPGSGTDFDKAGEVSPYGTLPEAGTLGGQRVQINPQMANPNFNAAKAQALQSPVPGMPMGQYYKNVALQDAYTGWRDNRLLNTRLAQASNYLKDANKFAYDIDKAQMLDYMNTPRGIAETQEKFQNSLTAARDAKSRAVIARAAAQDAANRFGTLGTQRTYFTG
tara:strand:- start:45 stop:785 length:741 start_codon:yes stop_codon:yes gene_type:complete